LSDLSSDGAEDSGDRFAGEARIRVLDLPANAARAREDREVLRGPQEALLARGVQNERRLQEIVIAAVGARADQRLVEGQPLAGALARRKGVARREGFRDHRRNVPERKLLVDLVDRPRARREARIGKLEDPFLPVPGLRDLVLGEDAVLRLA